MHFYQIVIVNVIPMLIFLSLGTRTALLSQKALKLLQKTYIAIFILINASKGQNTLKSKSSTWYFETES